MRLRASRGRFLDLAIRVTALVTVACTSLDGLTGKDPDTRDDGTLPDRSKGPGNADTLEPEPGPGGDPPAAERAERFCETNTATFCADTTVQVLGGDGITKEYGRAEQIFRDARALPIVGGTTEMAKYLIASADLPTLKPNL